MREMRQIGSVAEELAAFSRAVQDLIREERPVLIYPGCGDTIARGFLNLDVLVHPQLSPNDPRWEDREIFVFPFADLAWPVPDNSVDYVFHEDFFEHINQKQQVCFLAETLRVMKPGAWHRINTPCLGNSMRTHSDFSRGFTGVYTDEWDQHGHVNLMSRATLEEMALLVGYRYVSFNRKNGSLSDYRYPEGRPGPDRDQILGNLFADLLK